MIILQSLLICLCILTLSVQSVFKKQFGQTGIKGDLTYSALVTAFALLVFLITSGKPVLSPEIIPYSLAFAAVYVGGTVTSVLALRWGSLAITSLIMSYSLIIPTAYGLLFLNETAGVPQILGIVILLVSLFLVKGRDAYSQTKGFSVKWLIAVSISFVCNGLCSVIQKEQQRLFNGSYNGGFMILALAVAAAVSFAAGFLAEGQNWKQLIRRGFPSAALCGLSNGVTNYLVLVIVASVSASLFFPVLSAGQLIFTFLISVFFYRERFSPKQLVGLVLGIAALVLLNI